MLPSKYTVNIFCHVWLIFRSDTCVISCRLVCDITLHVFYLSQGLPGPDGAAGEKGETVSAAKLLLLRKVWISPSDIPGFPDCLFWLSCNKHEVLHDFLGGIIDKLYFVNCPLGF